MAKRINTTYFDNLHYDFDEYKEYYQEDKDLTDEEMENVSDNTIWEYIYDMQEMDWDDFFTNLDFSKFNDSYCVITGRLGLWDGHPTIQPVVCRFLSDAIHKCADGVDYVIIKQVNGHIEVDGIHHDGRNHFEIHLLNDKGIHAYDLLEWGSGNANLENRCYHKAISDYLY